MTMTSSQPKSCLMAVRIYILPTVGKNWSTSSTVMAATTDGPRFAVDMSIGGLTRGWASDSNTLPLDSLSFDCSLDLIRYLRVLREMPIARTRSMHLLKTERANISRAKEKTASHDTCVVRFAGATTVSWAASMATGTKEQLLM